LLSDNHPRPVATLAQQRVELSAAYADSATVGEGSTPAARLDGGHNSAFGGQLRFDERCDVVHALTNALVGPTVNESKVTDPAPPCLPVWTGGIPCRKIAGIALI
jgi:hypothetical protein